MKWDDLPTVTACCNACGDSGNVAWCHGMNAEADALGLSNWCRSCWEIERSAQLPMLCDHCDIPLVATHIYIPSSLSIPVSATAFHFRTGPGRPRDGSGRRFCKEACMIAHRKMLNTPLEVHDPCECGPAPDRLVVFKPSDDTVRKSHEVLERLVKTSSGIVRHIVGLRNDDPESAEDQPTIVQGI